jgi:hypothetical protein
MFSIFFNNRGSTVELFQARRKGREREWLKNSTPDALLLAPNVIMEFPMLSALCPMRFSRLRQEFLRKSQVARAQVVKEFDPLHLAPYA